MTHDEKNLAVPDDEDFPLSRSLVYLVSPRGGDNFYARVINGTDKEYLPEPNLPDWVPRESIGVFDKKLRQRMDAAVDSGEISPTDLALTEGSGAVHMLPNGRVALVVWSRWMNVASAADRKLCLIHEAGHIALRHLERVVRSLTEVTEPEVRAAISALNAWAIDFAVNDSVVRLEPEFEQVHRPRRVAPDGTVTFDEKGEWHFLMPEEYGLPVGQSYETYLSLMLADLRNIVEKADQTMRAISAGAGIGGKSESGGEGEGDEEDESGGAGEGAAKDDEDEDEEAQSKAVADAANKVRKMLKVDPDRYKDLFGKLSEAHDKVTGNKHAQWSKMVQNMSPEEALSIAEKMKHQAKALVTAAWEHSPNTRGFLPAGVIRAIEQLRAPPQVPWNVLFRDIFAATVQSRLVEEMVVPNLMLLNEDHIEPWPGFALDQSFNVTFLIDTSGSVDDKEFARACTEINAILQVNKSLKLTVLMCDATVQGEQTVESVQPMTEEEKRELGVRKGYGGTVYTPAFRRMLNEDTAADWLGGAKPEKPHPEPDLIIVYTDGGVCIEGEVFPRYRPRCGIIWLLAPGSHKPAGMSNVSPDRLIEMFNIRPGF